MLMLIFTSKRTRYISIPKPAQPAATLSVGLSAADPADVASIGYGMVFVDIR